MHQGRLVEEDTTVNIFSNPKNIITRQLVQQSLHLYTPDRTDDALTLKLTFIGNDSEEPLIASLIKNFNVTVNIRQALIENIQDTTVGFTICELTGENSAVQKALQFIQSTSINAEVLHASA
jgi:D-methionine transport system ATP-binding protein